ncbi:unnamed protein product [Eruca vesicaria subsp. sativa]|uniref:Uncharacterized protein n=1 Tax=Eruca vesicaria subsp. sativa TaxID=29727 RepID=A0ABC8IVZ0_ERUVS|nr:unnamed protein product [Eruca vesicaria subsp. sativa]
MRNRVLEIHRIEKAGINFFRVSRSQRLFPLCSFLFRRLELHVAVLLFRACSRYKALCSVQGPRLLTVADLESN